MGEARDRIGQGGAARGGYVDKHTRRGKPVPQPYEKFPHSYTTRPASPELLDAA